MPSPPGPLRNQRGEQEACACFALPLSEGDVRRAEGVIKQA